VSPADIRSARARLGLSANGLAEALRLGKGGGRTVRRWEAGDVAITGPAQVAIEHMLAKVQEQSK
jgi:DNA-binding transcriptional regulator YiaG